MSAKSKTQSALDLLAKNPKMTPYAAAKATGLSLSVMYRAVARRDRPRCKTCNHLL